jgi:hypothetical protein
MEQSNRALPTCDPFTFEKDNCARKKGGPEPCIEEAYLAPTFITNSPTLQTQQYPIAAVSTGPTDIRPDHGYGFEGLQTPPGSSYNIRSMEEYQEKDHLLTNENEKIYAGVIDLVTDATLVVTAPRSDYNDHRSQSKERSPSQVTRGNVRMLQSTNSTQSARPHLSDNMLHTYLQ